ncbi:hypothetical protein EYF80_018168 [Liparis tanakae]|uniref:Uncharacterized protein n=1 Tax=Liparis tanakae TaxID=230148 RepID=A0A4Z2I326_9TELE|nr:hypothetical protein EYF80_018168 [Liparis tanakae]
MSHHLHPDRTAQAKTSSCKRQMTDEVVPHRKRDNRLHSETPGGRLLERPSSVTKCVYLFPFVLFLPEL